MLARRAADHAWHDPVRGDFFNPLPAHGPIARSAADAALLLAGMRGHDPALPLARPGASATAPGTGARLRTASPGCGSRGAPTSAGCPSSRRSPGCWQGHVELLAAAGAVVVDAEPDLADADEVFMVLRRS